MGTHDMVRDQKSWEGRSPRELRFKHRTGRSACATRAWRKKLRYMSKFAAMFVRSDNTHSNRTQPIANLLMACS
jgi:hypothetical protein